MRGAAFACIVAIEAAQRAYALGALGTKLESRARSLGRLRGGAEAWRPLGTGKKTGRSKRAVDARLVLSSIGSYAWQRASWGSRALLAASACALLTAKSLNVMVPSALQLGVDALSSGDADAALRWMTVYCAAKVLVSFVSEVRSTTFSRCSQRATRMFSADVFAKLHALDANYHASNPAGAVSVIFARGARGFASLAFLVFFSVAPTIAELALSVRALGRRSGSAFLGVVALVTFVSYAAYTAVVVQVRIATRKKLVELETRKGALLADSLANQDAVKTCSNERVEVRRFDGLLKCVEDLSVSSQLLGSLLNFGQAAVFAAGLAVSLRHAVGEFAKRPTEFSLGDVVAVNALLLQLAQPMNFLGYTVSEIRQGLVDTNAMLEILQEDASVYKARVAAELLRSPERRPPPPLALTAGAEEGPTIKKMARAFTPQTAYVLATTSNPDRSVAAPEIRFDDVWSSRDGGRSFALRGASFVAPAGRCTCLVGGSGSGKSTALRLCALLDGAPVSGAVYAWGADVAAGLGPYELRRRVALVPQATDLFDDSALYNIRYGDLAKPDDHARRAAAVVGLADHVDLDESVGERGARLSGGERQRVHVARALLRDAPLCLADEPTAAQDAETETQVVSALLSTIQHRGRTLLVVAHRLAAITPVADHIVVFKDGRVVQQGSHTALLRQKQGEYAKLWRASNQHRVAR
ncbi:hypothetical protein CTAYLR_008878 [Chrysophaeum taylorii]|uniref:Uncharacterized protein n=1 Tax=Chrysophaeum taylorii TaxID=2483200 RepID=A0AAD7U6D9_9STRA|nr:hypothetical protein CTAYLR_008878 [Chrysophaeum taylorii]